MSATSSTSIEIKLAGQKIVLKTSETDPAILKEIVELVSAKIKLAEKRGKGSAAHQVALVALMDLANEYKREMNSRSDSLMRILDSELGA